MMDTTRSLKKSIVKSESGSVELREQKKGLLVIDIPEKDQKNILQETINSLDMPDMDLERLKHIFDIIDEHLIVKNEGTGADISVEPANLDGLHNRRSEMEILAIILKVARKGAIKTKILRQANLSGKQLNKYIGFLSRTGFIEKQPGQGGGNVFCTTARGRLFLSYWTKTLSLIETKPSGSSG
jgi:predicted transcriptional regulator